MAKTRDDERPLRDNPSGDKFLDMEEDGRLFEVVHHGVGFHRTGAVLSAKEFGPAAELPRLVKLGAVRELSRTEVENHNETKRVDGLGPQDGEVLEAPSSVEPTGTLPKAPPLPAGLKPPAPAAKDAK